MIFTESGITINLDDSKNPFRFEDCEAYQKVKSLSVTEMDVCWIEKQDDSITIFLVELKQLFDPNNPKFKEKDISVESIENDFLSVFYKNVWHSVSMLAQNRSSTQLCSSLITQTVFQNSAIKVIFILNIKPSLAHYLDGFQKKLKLRLMDAVAIFKIESVAVLSYEDAKEFYPTIVQ